MSDPGFGHFYRIAQTDPPELVNFQLAKERGSAAPASLTRLAVWDGLSVYSTINQARRKQRISTWLGAYIVTLRVPTDGSIRIERTLGGDGHHTLWAPAEVLRRLAVSIQPA